VGGPTWPGVGARWKLCPAGGRGGGPTIAEQQSPHGDQERAEPPAHGRWPARGDPGRPLRRLPPELRRPVHREPAHHVLVHVHGLSVRRPGSRRPIYLYEINRTFWI